MKIPKKVEDRFSSNLPKFKRILKKAHDKDVNESDTVSIITDMLSDIFGYDKYDEVTSEYAIKSTFCDLAIKIKNKVRFLIEVKAVGISLKENHLNQALAYGAKEGIDWIILSNGINWEVYKVLMKSTLDTNQLCSFNIFELNLRNEEDKNNLFILCREGLSADAISEFHEKINILNKYIVSGIITNDQIVNSIRLQLKKLSSGIKVTNDEVLGILNEEIIKREILDNDDYKKAKSKIKRSMKPK